MLKTRENPGQVAVWIAMADHFLDTETRHDLPLTALRCVQAGLTITEARDVWQYEVSPAVGFNCFDVAGEWAGWDRDWLLARIERVRVRWWNRIRPWRSFGLARLLMAGQWLAIERCIECLQTVDSPADRERLARDLATLAGHLFDFCPADLSALEPERYDRLRALYPEPFLGLMDSALISKERALIEPRMQAAFAGINLRATQRE